MCRALLSTSWFCLFCLHLCFICSLALVYLSLSFSLAHCQFACFHPTFLCLLPVFLICSPRLMVCLFAASFCLLGFSFGCILDFGPVCLCLSVFMQDSNISTASKKLAFKLSWLNKTFWDQHHLKFELFRLFKAFSNMNMSILITSGTQSHSHLWIKAEQQL